MSINNHLKCQWIKRHRVEGAAKMTEQKDPEFAFFQEHTKITSICRATIN